MNNTNNTIDNFLLAIGSAYFLADVKNVLGIIILIIQLLNILVRLGMRVIKGIQLKEPVLDIMEDVASVFDDIEEQVTTIKEDSNTDVGD